MPAPPPIATARISTARTCSNRGFPKPGHTDSGWLNRLLAGLPKGERVTRTAETRALAIGANAPLVIRGSAPVLGWAPPMLKQADPELPQRLTDLYAHTDPLLSRVLAEGIQTGKIASGLDMKARGGPGDPNGMEQMATGAARLLAQSEGPRIAALAFDGWDTHARSCRGSRACWAGSMSRSPPSRRRWARPGRTPSSWR